MGKTYELDVRSTTDRHLYGPGWLVVVSGPAEGRLGPYDLDAEGERILHFSAGWDPDVTRLCRLIMEALTGGHEVSITTPAERALSRALTSARRRP